MILYHYLGSKNEISHGYPETHPFWLCEVYYQRSASAFLSGWAGIPDI